MVTHTSIYAWQIPGTEGAGAGRLQSMESQSRRDFARSHTVRPPGCVKDLKRKLSLSFHPNCPSRQENVPNPGCGSPSEGEASLAVSHSLGRGSRLSLGALPQPL